MSSTPNPNRLWTGNSAVLSTKTRSRPWTGHSRPTTARPQTAASVRHEGSYVIAILEGRGVSREVGIAALDRDTGHVMLAQVVDCPTYVKSLHQMHLHNPCLLLIPDTFLSASDAALAPAGKRSASTSLLVQYIGEEFPGVQIDPMGRRYWNDAGGLEFIMQLCVENDERAGTILAVSNKYYCLSAACALFKYVEARLNIRFAAGSLRIKYAAVDGTMLIDPDSARNLELVGNMTHRKSNHSLFGVLNHTFTPMASRLLRANILSPITLNSAIDARLDVVEELINAEDKFTCIRDALKPLSKMDLDKLIAALASSEAKVTTSAKPASQRVVQILNLRSIVKNLPQLRKALEGSQSQLLRIVHDMLCDERIDMINNLICSHLNDESGLCKGGLAALNARVYAVKANLNRLLDVARETYKENIADIYQLNRVLSEEHGLPLTLVYQNMGFVFALKKNDLDGEFPKGFLNTELKKGRWIFSSMELKKLNARLKDALDETLLLSDKIIQDLVAQIISNIGALYKASESVSTNEVQDSIPHSGWHRSPWLTCSGHSHMCPSFETMVPAFFHSDKFNTDLNVSPVRPEFTGTLAIKSGLHPILETLSPAGTLVPNDVYCDDSSCFQVIRGPNMSGKSTYLRQIGLLVLMAMCGCFVPAEYASFRIHDALLTRLSNDDDMEKNLSTFASEMASSAMILGLATSKSLVLIDELGRGTSPHEGVGISHAIAEALIALKPFVFFATHFNELTKTLSRQPMVVNLHLSVQRSQASAVNCGMTFQYKILDGIGEDFKHYGIDLARLADLPSDVLMEARQVAEKLAFLQTHDEESSESHKLSVRRKALLRLRTQLTQAYEYSALPDLDLLVYIGRFQADIAKVFLH